MKKKIYPNKKKEEIFILVKDFFEEGKDILKLELISNNQGLQKKITHSKIQKPGLALTGYVDFIHPGRVQVLGQLEINYLNKLSSAEREKVLTKVFQKEICCMVITSDLRPPKEIIKQANKKQIPLFKSSLVTSKCIEAITNFLSKKLAPKKRIHGVLLDIYGQGVLIIGESGIGKSESALDLIVRGHRLVSDDVVEIYLESSEKLIGSAPSLIRHHMEVRGLGIINIKDLFGISSITLEKKIDLVIELKKWKKDTEYDRLGLESTGNFEILAIELPLTIIPVAPGRNIAILIEVATKNHLLKRKDYHPAQKISEYLNQMLNPDQNSNSIKK
ncbi:MAG: HPr(Ser) kinase/phosphatase [Candidatus Aminicenantia bacterium]